MNLRLNALEIFFPAFIKKRIFRQLVGLTASAFEKAAPDLAGLSFESALLTYALFTQNEVLKSADKRLLIKDRLFNGGREMGRKLRKSFKLRTREDVLNAARILYRMIGINFHGEASGEIAVNQCYFAKFYTSEVCNTMASLDEGILAGLSGGGEFKFSKTITEKNDSCRGILRFKDTKNEASNSRGTGAGGATAAKELQGAFDVTVLEAGGAFRPFNTDISLVEKVKRAGLLFDEREIQLLFPAMRIQRTSDRMVLVKGIASGGTTTIATGNALRMDADLKAIGIDLDPEFEELYAEIPVSTAHQRRWRPITERLFEICEEMGLEPRPTPKMVDYAKCIRCGECVLGCKQGAKWDSRKFLNAAVDKGALLIEHRHVQRCILENGTVIGVETRRGLKREFYPADLVVLAAGGLGTPIILKNSGIDCQPSMFVDPVLCVATEWNDSFMNKEIPMPFVVQRENFIVSPYFDYLSFFFNRDWKYRPHNTLALMIKLADSNAGSVSNSGVKKSLSDVDKEYLRKGVDLCIEIFGRLGARKENIFLGTLNAGHPGGMLPLTESEAVTLHHHHLPKNLYVADATLFPRSLGNPPIFTIMAMAKRVSKLCIAIDTFSKN